MRLAGLQESLDRPHWPHTLPPSSLPAGSSPVYICVSAACSSDSPPPLPPTFPPPSHALPGPPPVYIGFGSLVVGEPERLTRCFLDAIKATGLRAIIQKGWGGLGAGIAEGDVPEDVLLIGVAPHDWMFERVGGWVGPSLCSVAAIACEAPPAASP